MQSVFDRVRARWRAVVLLGTSAVALLVCMGTVLQAQTHIPAGDLRLRREIYTPKVRSQPPPPSVSPDTAVRPSRLHTVPEAPIAARELFRTDDAAIIVVGGKQIQAGDLKREINAELARTSGPVTVFRGSLGKAAHLHSPGTNVPANPGTYTTRHTNPNVMARRFAQPMEMYRPQDCGKVAPEITAVRGRVMSGDRFTLDGTCFGNTAGVVELIGQFQGGVLRPAFAEWRNGRIVVVLPSIRGTPDSPVAITVVRADRVRSPALQAQFIAARERIEVPAHLWTPTGHVDKTDVYQGGGNIFAGYTVVGTAGTVAAPFNLRVNAQCALDNLDVVGTVGRVVAVSGFEHGPLHEAAITVNVAPTCTTRTFNYIVGSDSTTWCRMAFQLRTWAYCPAGTGL